MIPEHAESLHSQFEREGIPLLLAGGWAVNFYGYSRFTNDVDWICSRETEGGAIKLMETLGFTKVSDGMASRFVRPEDMGFPPVDLIWVDGGTFRNLADMQEKTGRHENIGVIGFESLLAMKIYALKDDKARRGKDLLDIRFLLDQNRKSIGEERLIELCERFSGPDAYQLIRQLP